MYLNLLGISFQTLTPLYLIDCRNLLLRYLGKYNKLFSVERVSRISI